MANGKRLEKPEKGKSIGKWRKECDKLMQIKGQKLFPKSLLSGLPTQVMHHFFPKSVSARLRYEWDNLIPLTNGEHMRLHQSGDPTYEHRIIEIKGKDWYNKLLETRKEQVKINVAYYRAIKEQLQ